MQETAKDTLELREFNVSYENDTHTCFNVFSV